MFTLLICRNGDILVVNNKLFDYKEIVDCSIIRILCDVDIEHMIREMEDIPYKSI